MTKKVYSDILKMAGAILGVFLYAAAFRIILVPLNLYSGGFTGISQVPLNFPSYLQECRCR